MITIHCLQVGFPFTCASFINNETKHTFRNWNAFSRVNLPLPVNIPTIYPMDCSLPSSSLHGILQARVLEWVAISSFRRSSQPRDQTRVSFISSIAGGFFATELLGKPPNSLNSHVRINNSFLRGLDWGIHLIFIFLPFPWTRHFHASGRHGFTLVFSSLLKEGENVSL